MSANLAHLTRRRLVQAAGAVCLVPGALAQSTYPAKPVRIVVPFPPGGYADLTSRMLATEWSAKYKQAFVVDNKPGAGGNIGAEIVAKAAPDGYTLLMGTIGTHAINPHIYKKMPYQALTQFEPIMFIADAESVLVVPAASSLRSVKDLVTRAKAAPGRLTYGSAGTGSTGHLAGELFEELAAVHLVHIPYRGNAPALTDLVAGQTDLSFATLQTALPFVQSGQLRALAVLGKKRSTLLPDTPTLQEVGPKNFEVRNWAGLFAPAATPAAVVQQLYQDADVFMQSPETQAKLARQALTYIGMGPRPFSQFVSDESKRWAAVVKAANIAPE